MIATVIDPKTQIGQQSTHHERVRVSDYQRLKDEGLLVELEITGTSIFQTSVDWAELGVDLSSARARRMTPGRKYLYPKEDVARLSSVTSKMRQALTRLTHDIQFCRPYRYLHYKRYQEWVDAWGVLSTEFALVRDDLVAAYEAAVDALAEEFNQIAFEAWTANDGQTIIFKAKPYDDLDSFTDAVVTSVLAKMPAKDKIASDLKAAYHTATVQGLDDIAREEARAELERQRARAEAEKLQMDSARAQDDLAHARRMQQYEEEQKRVEIEAMMHAEAEHIRGRLSEITSPLEETFIALRQQMAESAQEMIDSITKNGYVHGRVAQRGLETLGELMKARSIVDDSRLVEKIADLRAAIGPVGDKAAPDRSTEAVTAALEAIKNLVSQARADFNAEPSRFSMLD